MPCFHVASVNEFQCKTHKNGMQLLSSLHEWSRSTDFPMWIAGSIPSVSLAQSLLNWWIVVWNTNIRHWIQKRIHIDCNIPLKWQVKVHHSTPNPSDCRPVPAPGQALQPQSQLTFAGKSSARRSSFDASWSSTSTSSPRSRFSCLW